MSSRDVRGQSLSLTCGAHTSTGACRADLRQVLAALGAGLRSATDRDLPVIFEHEVQQLLSMRSVRLREVPARYQARLVTPTRTMDSIVLGVPTGDPRIQAVLEASTEADRTLDEWDFEMLTAAAQLGGLVLEAARTRLASHTRLEDGAAPLTGSSTVMQELR